MVKKLLRKVLSTIMYFISDKLISVGMWLDDKAYEIIITGQQIDADLMKERYWWQK